MFEIEREARHEIDMNMKNIKKTKRASLSHVCANQLSLVSCDIEERLEAFFNLED